MSIINLQKAMLVKVAEALGDMLSEVVFVGGCTTGLLVTDDFTKEQIRYTDDVDLIVNIASYAAWAQLQVQLRQKGFKESMDEPVICRMLLGELQVDFMPIDDSILGFSNRWYKPALDTAEPYVLNEQLSIFLVKPEYFIGTKLEAYKGRGKGDALASHDIEDLLNIFDGRAAIVSELNAAPEALKKYIQTELNALLEDENFEYAIQSTAHNDSSREALIYERIEQVINEQ
ncbi:MAG: putative nucleotidyltransferase [Oleiphilaceae bacterium]|jgi:predicted nucleotidyltransferase